MAYSVDDIIKDVLVAIDENRVAEDVLADSPDVDTLEMSDIIKAKIADGINNVYLIAPVEKLGESLSVKTSQGVTVTSGVGSMTLPSNMLRLIAVKVASWKRPATMVTPIGSPQYLQQFSEFAGVKGHASKPVVTPSANTQSALDLYTCKTTDTTATLSYVAQVSAPSTTVTSYTIPAGLYRACIYKISALTMANYENAGMLQLFNSLCLEQLGMATKSVQ